MSVDEVLIRRLGARLNLDKQPGDVQLAVALSIATRIEPELVRAVRLRVLPHLDVGAESDFWFSDWVGVRNPHVVALRPALLPMLHAELTQWWLSNAQWHPIRGLSEVVEKLHVDLSPALIQEEEATRRAILDRDPVGAALLLQKPLHSLRAESRDGIANWVAGAVHRLPKDVLDSQIGWHLRHEARRKREDIDLPEVPETLTPDEHAWAAAQAGLASFPLSLHGGLLIIGGAPDRPGTAALPIPITTPMWIEILAPGQPQGRRHGFRMGQELRVPGVPQGTRLRTADGALYDLFSVAADGVAVPLESEEEPAQEPVTLADEPNSGIWLPSRLLARVREVTPLDGGSLDALRGWRDQPAQLGIRLLLGWTHDERVRLADQFAADSVRGQWQILRARHASGYWSGAGPAVAAGSSTLLVVDHVESWYFRSLPELIGGLHTGAHAPVRVLFLADALGPWWEALDYALSRDGTADVTSVQRLTPSPDTRQERHRLFHRAVHVVATVLPGTAREDVVSPPVLDSATLSPADIQLLAVATALGAAATQPNLDLEQARRVILRREHDDRVLLYEQERSVFPAESLSKLVFLAVLMHPLPVAVAAEVARAAGVVSGESEWWTLSEGFQSCYPQARAGLVDPQWPDQLADALLGAVLVAQASSLGVDQVWAADDVLARFGELAADPRTVAGVWRALGVLARAGRTHPGLVSRWLLPFAWQRPGVVVDAGGAVLLAVAEHADIDLLERLHGSLHDVRDRPVELDPADAFIAEKLLENRLHNASLERQAQLRADLGIRLARAGRFGSARTVTEQAVTNYQNLAMARPTSFLLRQAEVLVQLSDQLGELGRPGPALQRAEEAEDLARRHARMVGASDEGDLGSALAGVGRQRARAGQTELALGAAEDAVILLAPAARINRTGYEPDLAEALVSLSDRRSEAGQGGRALAAARQAVELCEQLSQTNPRAHVVRLAAALLAFGRRRTENGDADGGLGYTERSVRLYRELTRASSLRFEPLLADAEVFHAIHLLAVGRSRDAQIAILPAIERLRALDPDAHRPLLAWSLTQLGRILLSLEADANAQGPLREALDIYQRLPPGKSKRDSDSVHEARHLLDLISRQWRGAT